jgi:VanZ family protein
MVRAFLPAFLWLSVLTGLSVLPGVQLPKVDLFSPDKIGHLVGYGILTWLILRALRPPQGGRVPARIGAWACLFAILYGILMEFVQYYFIPGRFYEYDDMMANGAGAAVAWALFSRPRWIHSVE